MYFFMFKSNDPTWSALLRGVSGAVNVIVQDRAFFVKAYPLVFCYFISSDTIIV